MNNKQAGNKFESELCGILAKIGFWAYNCATKTSGQPADIIAARNGKPYLIDAKECKRNTYDTNRIEENQKNAMFLWEMCGNGQGYFALKLADDSIYMIDHNTMLLARQDKRVLNRQDIIDLGTPFYDWEASVP